MLARLRRVSKSTIEICELPMENARRKEPPILPVILGLFLALLAGHLFKFWLSPNLSFALGYFLAVLFLGFFRQRLQLSWGRLIFGAF